MRSRRIFGELYRSYLITTVLALVAVSWIALRSVNQFYLDRVAEGLESRALRKRAMASLCLSCFWRMRPLR